ncbi:MAG: adenylate/guanylate cyclase domain-containing protein, partial [Candidatus Omnitrophica bacterium]|nr:adenylate/guanylate cyclase domain-containing protein [Candidatus Omnitrophota bacterium]
GFFMPLKLILTLTAMCLVFFVIRFLEFEIKKRRIRNAFGRYVSPGLVEKLVKRPELLRLGGEKKILTLLFCDIRHFNSIAQTLTAHELANFLNRFLTPMTDIVLKQNGTIDKYVGDCLMAFWNAPLEDPDHARHACEAALNMRRHLVDWNRELYAEARAVDKIFVPIQIGIGISSGECCVGNMGPSQHFNYSVLGDDVGVASRLENLSKIYGIDILISESTNDIVSSDYATMEADRIRVKAGEDPIRIFALFGGRILKQSDEFQNLLRYHEEMLEAYRSQRWLEALKLIRECSNWDTPRFRVRMLYELYTKRIQSYRLLPPDPDWDGTYDSETK